MCVLCAAYSIDLGKEEHELTNTIREGRADGMIRCVIDERFRSAQPQDVAAPRWQVPSPGFDSFM